MSWQLILRIFSVISLVTALVWVVQQPGFEPVLAVIAGISGIVTSFFVSSDPILKLVEVDIGKYLLDKIDFNKANPEK